MRNQEDILKEVMKKRTTVEKIIDHPFEIERKESVENESSIAEKIKTMLEVSTRISLDRMQDVLEMEKKRFNKRIFDLAKQYGFTIDGDYLIVNKETVSDFVDSLEKKFKEWEKLEDDESYKIK